MRLERTAPPGRCYGGFQSPRRLSRSAKTPPSARAVQSAHLRGAPYSAKPNTAGGRYPCFEKLAALLVADFADVFFAAFYGKSVVAGIEKAAVRLE